MKQVIRGIASFLLIILGGALSLFSMAVAFGWDRGPFSVFGIIVAICGLSIMFGGYWLVRSMDGGALAAACLKLAFGFGATFIVVGLIALFIPGTSIPMPVGYFLSIGSLCLFAFYGFRAYTREH